MKRINYLALALLAAGTLATTSCKKDAASKSNSEYLMNGSWKITSENVSYSLSGASQTSVIPIDNCQKDDKTNFNSGGVLVNDEGAVKCNSSDPQTTTGTWSLASDNKTLTIVDGSGANAFTGNFNIDQIDDNTLKLSNQADNSGITYKTTITFSH